MSSEKDDLEALFDAESALFAQPSAAAPPSIVAPDSEKAAGLAGDSDNLPNDLEKYYQSVSGLYLQPALPAIAAGDQASAAHVAAASLHSAADQPIYERLGGIVRQLHDSLRELGYDKSLSESTSQIAESKDRLEYIATLTEQSAVKVLNTLESGMPAQDALIKQGREMEARWAMLFAGKTGIDEFKILAADARQFAASVVSEGEKEKARLLEIMMAQDFQDLTGQIIKKVVGVTKSIEQDLAKLLLDNAPAAVKEKHVELMSGPSLSGTALAQDDVDDMLADLGF